MWTDKKWFPICLYKLFLLVSMNIPIDEATDQSRFSTEKHHSEPGQIDLEDAVSWYPGVGCHSFGPACSLHVQECLFHYCFFSALGPAGAATTCDIDYACYACSWIITSMADSCSSNQFCHHFPGVAGSADAADVKLVEAYGDKLNQIEDVFKHVYHIYYSR